LDETTDLGNDEQFMVFVWLRTAWSNFSFAVQLPTYHKKSLRSRFLHYSASADSLRVCVCRWCFRYGENQKGFLNSWKWKGTLVLKNALCWQQCFFSGTPKQRQGGS